MLGLTHAERNAPEDTKRVVEQLRKNGTVDSLFSQALNTLFQNEAFKSEVRQYLQKPKPQGEEDKAIDHIKEMALSTLPGLLAGIDSLPPAQQQQQQQQQQQSQPQQPQAAAAAAAAARGGPARPAPQQQPGVHKLQQQRPPPQVSIPEDMSLKLQLGLIQMLEMEEGYLQAQFRAYYEQHMQQLRGGDGSAFERAQHSSRAGRQDSGRSFVQSEFITAGGPPKAAQSSPTSPTLRYAATSEFELLEQSEPQQ